MDDLPERLNELRQQKELLNRHLAWLDREIARESDRIRRNSTPDHMASPNAVPAPSFDRTEKSSEPDPVLPDIGEVTPQFQTDPDQLRQNVRKGCLIYVAATAALLVLSVLTLYLIFSL